MSQQIKEQDHSRREFLRAAAITAAAATATGAGAAWLGTHRATIPPPAAPAGVPSLAIIPVANMEAVADLFAQLTAAQADNVRLQARLDAAQRRLNSEQSDNSQLGAMRLELDTATQQVSVLSGLLALYERWEEVDLSQALNQGLAAVSSSVAELIDQLPTLTEGIEAGRQALDELEGQIPILENGRRWLEEHSNRLNSYFKSFEQLLAAVADATAPLLVMLNQWFQDVLRWLPFGLGQRASEIMQAMAALLTETPHTISGLRSNIAEPLDAWLGDASVEAPLRQNLVKPLREQVLQRTDQAMTQARQVEAVYRDELAMPAYALAQQQQALRQLIVEYRQRHEIA